MKKMICIGIAVMCLLTFAACGGETAPETPDVLVPAVFHNGTVYITTGEEMPAEVAPEAIVGQIVSEVPLNRWPAQEGEANFKAMDAFYAEVEDGLAVVLDEEWVRFVPLEE